MIHHFIINPAAGKGTLTEALTRRIQRVCNANKTDYVIYTTKRPGDATRYVKEVLANEQIEIQRFYACGGDGTLSEVVNGGALAENAEFGVIPIGTGNDFQRNFINPEYFFDIARQVAGKPLAIDILRYNDRYSLNVLNVGFDSKVVKKTEEIKRSHFVPTGFAYGTGVAITLCKPFGTQMKLTLQDGTVIEDTLLLCAIANGCFYGGGFCPAPKASLTDGLLDIAIVNKMSRFKFLSMISSYKNGTYLEKEATKSIASYHKTSSLLMEFPVPTEICVDGELEITERVQLDIVPRALRFSIPDGSATLAEAASFNADKQKEVATL